MLAVDARYPLLFAVLLLYLDSTAVLLLVIRLLLSNATLKQMEWMAPACLLRFKGRRAVLPQQQHV